MPVRHINAGYGLRARRGSSTGATQSAMSAALMHRAAVERHVLGDARRVLQTAVREPQNTSTGLDPAEQRRVHEALAALRDVEVTHHSSENRILHDLMAPIPGIAGPGTANVSQFNEIVFHKPGKGEKSDGASKPVGRAPRGLAELLADSPRVPDSCAICLNDFIHGEKLRVLPCDGAHAFHERCLKLWLARNPSCPMCREDVRPGPVELDPEIARRVLQDRNMRSRGRPRRGLSVDAYPSLSRHQ